ncbi:glycosyltransferase family 2 protein [bacterium]|nr:glycosyltransferase family 2 protein [bacterium]MBQ4439191.1 glycosyltransferase family 2 protein [bacterium]
MPIEFSIIVCTYNRASMLADCIDSLLNQTADKNRFEIIIVDNNSTDNTEEIAKELVKNHNNIKCFKEPIAGYSAPRNCGWKNATGNIVAYIDDDEIASPYWLESIEKAFQIEKKPDIVGGICLPKYDAAPPDWFTESMGGTNRNRQKGILNQRNDSYLGCGNIAFKKEVLEQLNGFSNDFDMKNGFLMMGEDTDICQRAMKAGFQLYYDSDIKIYHRMNQNNYDIEVRKQKAEKTGMTARFIFGRKPFFSHYFKYLTYFSMILADTLNDIFSKKITTKSVILKEKIAYRKGYFEMDQKLKTQEQKND